MFKTCDRWIPRADRPSDCATVALEYVRWRGEPWPGLTNPEITWLVDHSDGDDSDRIWAAYRALFQEREEAGMPLPSDFREYLASFA